MLEFLLYFLIYWIIGVIVIYLLVSKINKYSPDSGFPVIWAFGPFIYPLLLIGLFLDKVLDKIFKK